MPSAGKQDEDDAEDAAEAAAEVSKTPSLPRSWANSSFL
jgi:hypothetical protein